MLKKLYLHSLRRGIKPVFTALFITAVMSILMFFSSLDIQKGISAYDTVTSQNLSQHRLIEMKVTYNYGLFTTVTNRKFRSTKAPTTDMYYLVGLGNPGERDFRLVTLVLPESYSQQMNDMAVNTANGVPSEALEILAVVTQNNSEYYRNASIYLMQAGVHPDSINQILLPQRIKFYNYEDQVKLLKILGLFAVGSLVVAIVLLLYALSGLRLLKLKKEVENLGYTWDYIEEDYENAKILIQKPSFRIGHLCTFFYSDATPHILLNSHIALGYYDKHVLEGKAGLKKVTHMVYFCQADGSCFGAEVPSHAKAIEILNIAERYMPWVVIDHDEKNQPLLDLFLRDKNVFLGMKYRKVDYKITQLSNE